MVGITRRGFKGSDFSAMFNKVKEAMIKMKERMDNQITIHREKGNGNTANLSVEWSGKHYCMENGFARSVNDKGLSRLRGPSN